MSNSVPQLRRSHKPSQAIAAFVLAMAALVAFADAGSAQYGGTGVQVFVDPVRVPIDSTFDVFGRNCTAGSTVEITIDGVSGILATGTASSNGFYTVVGVPLPTGLLAGTNQDVRATCGPQSGTALITLVCPGGTDPVAGLCPDGRKGVVDGTGPTTTAPNGTNSTPNGTSPDQGLAFTGAAYTSRLLQGGVTIVALGIFLIVVGRRRQDTFA